MGGYYRSDEDGGVLAAEQSGQILIGDLIDAIDGIDVRNSSIESIRDLLRSNYTAERTMEVQFIRLTHRLSAEDLILDPRFDAWLEMYFEDYCSQQDADATRKKRYWCRVLCAVSSHSEILEPFDGGSTEAFAALVQLLQTISQDLLPTGAAQSAALHVLDLAGSGNCESCEEFMKLVNELKRKLLADIQSSFMLRFEHCNVYSKMRAWAYSSHKVPELNIGEILRHPSKTLGFYLHLARSGR